MADRQRSFLSLLVPAALLLAALLVCGGCAARRTLPETPPPPEYASGVWVFRHRVQLDIPRMQISRNFDGVMRLELGKNRAHVVALGGLGIRLFDLVISADGVHVIQIHPALARMPGAAKRIGECVANIWFDSLPQIQLHKFSRRDGWNVVFSGPLIAALWPEETLYSDTRVPFTLSIRLLQAVEETP